MTRSKKRGKRLGVVLASAVAAVAVSGISAGAASADPIQVTFPNSALDLGPLVKGQDITPDANDLVITGDRVGTTVTVEPGGFDFDPGEMTIAGNDLTLDLVLMEQATGQIDLVTGELAMDPDTTVRAVISQVCAITTEMPFSTSASQTRPDFQALLGTPLTLANPIVSGAIATNWATLPDAEALAVQCTQGTLDTINSVTKGPGGIWFGAANTTAFTRQVKPATPPPPGPTPAELRAACIKQANAAFKKKVKKAKSKKAKKALVLKKKKAITACKKKFA
jgi:hypothetical protein